MVGLTPDTGLADIGLSDSTLHIFTAALQGVLAAVVSVAVSSPSLSSPMGKVTILSLLYLCFAIRVAMDGDLSPIWEAAAGGK